MRAPLLLVALAAATMLISACPARPAAPSPPPPLDLTAPPPRVPSFRAELVPYFQRTCAQARDCHGEHPNLNVDLDLHTADRMWSQLVNHASAERRGAVLVKPGDPDASFLVAKLTGKLRDREGKAMPEDPETGAPLKPVPFDPDFIEQALRPWIVAGAPNN